MVVNQRLKVIHDMWIKNIIEPSHVISYLDKLDLGLISLTLGGILATSKDKKTTYSYGE
tara:strand:+ start:611 stop:787 length:177 start_codon:yes stop_codon:yes gene_type:complete